MVFIYTVSTAIIEKYSIGTAKGRARVAFDRAFDGGVVAPGDHSLSR